jgi:GntR family transcriptional regulator / MocR family aminotransferase
MGSRLGQEAWRSLLKLSGSEVGIQAQLRKALSAAISAGHLNSQTPLPSSRDLARILSISRTSVSLAYQRLVDDGYLISQERQGYFVNAQITGAIKQGLGPRCAPDAARRDWASLVKMPLSAQRNIHKPQDWSRYPYPFIFGQRDPKLLPIAAWRECWREAQSVQNIVNAGCDLLDQDDPLLVEHLRSRVLPRRGIWARPENILITLGAQNALALLAQLLVRPTDTVGIEDPGYPDARNLFELEAGCVKPLQVDEEGLKVDSQLDECDYLFVTPSYQSPTTVTLSSARRRALLEKAARHDIVIIEDDYESEAAFDEEPMPALKSDDETGCVVYCGSLSKSLGPGLRFGYLVADAELIRQARALRRLMFRHPPPLIQQAVGLFIEFGHYDSYLHRLSGAYAERWAIMAAALDRWFPDSGRRQAFGGTAFWIKGPEWLDASLLAVEARGEGILIEPGAVHFAGPHIPRNYFRLGFSAIPNERIDPGMEKLARIVDTLERGNSRH